MSWLISIFYWLVGRGCPSPFISFSTVSEDNTITQGDHMHIVIPDTKAVPTIITAAPALDAAGNPGVFAGGLSWSVLNPNLVKLVGSADALSVSVTPLGPVGITEISVTDGVITEKLTVEVVSTETKDIDFTVTDGPAPAPVADAAPSVAPVADAAPAAVDTAPSFDEAPAEAQ